MFEGVYFQFPKLAFLLFFFLACEALCPLRSNPLYFPRAPMFGTVGVKPPLWLWIAKWAMITFLVVALMSPVKEKELIPHEGYDILLVIDPLSIQKPLLEEVSGFIRRRGGDRIALWVPGKSEVIIPLTREHEAIFSILSQLSAEEGGQKVTRTVSRFFSTSHEGKGWTVILSANPEQFVYSLPIGIETSVVEPAKELRWAEMIDRSHPPYPLPPSRRYVDYYYVYPLFLGFLAMLAYLYGRNQRGLQ